MVQSYGQKWTKDHGTSPIDGDLWIGALNSLNPEQLKMGMRKLMASGDEWPPTLPKFMGLCHRTQAQAINDSEPLPALEDLTDRSSTGRKWKAFMIIHGLLSRSSTMTMEQAQSMRDANPSEFKLMLTAHERETSKLRNRMGL